jgi:hypothetical protein
MRIFCFGGDFECQTIVSRRKMMAREGSLFQGEKYPLQSTYSEDGVLPPTNARMEIRPCLSFWWIAHSGDWSLGQARKAKCCVRIPIIPVGILGAPSCQLDGYQISTRIPILRSYYGFKDHRLNVLGVDTSEQISTGTVELTLKRTARNLQASSGRRRVCFMTRLLGSLRTHHTQGQSSKTSTSQ